MTPGLAQILLPLAMLIAGPADGPPPDAAIASGPVPVAEVGTSWRLAEWPAPVQADADAPQGPARDMMRSGWRPQTWDQVRIEQRLTIRIAPHRARRRDMLAAIPSGPMPQRFVERRSVRCLPVGGIAGVQVAGDDRLVLFMRDQRLIGANLEKACSARDFYSGFYLENSSDGKLCAKRDILHSRSGMNCGVSRMHVLVPAD
ncbi:hypothetical protein RXV95_05640 [Novosphingobium sp. ZN18A2]|uniref:hypothetical protein n=1 Tax=Novosphingobium sp. ZN18A2 TaxID=3079861 RepID=UPI0030D5E9B2